MSIRQKIFLSIFGTACVLMIAISALGFRAARSHLEQQYVTRYESLNGVIAHTLRQLEQNADHISLSALEYLRTHMEEHGIPDNDTLAAMAKRLNVYRLFVIGTDGKFLRDSKGAAELPEVSLFDFCPGYRELVTGNSALEMTPIVPDAGPYTGAHKFTMAPNQQRTHILEVAMRLDFITETLRSVLDSDKNILSVSMLSPSGLVLGRLSADSIEFAPSGNEELPAAYGGRLDYATQTAEFSLRIPLGTGQCCECKVKGLTGSDGAYFYVLKSKVSLKSLAHDIDRLTTTILAACAIALIISLILARWLSQLLISRLGRISNTVQTIVSSGDLSLRLNEGGNDEAAVLARNFDRMIDTIQVQQEKILSSEKDRVLANVASQVAHDVRSPLTALETVLSNTKGIEEEKRVMIRTATKRIKDIANNLLEVYRTDRRGSNQHRSRRPWHVGMLVESIVSEKRVRYGDYSGLQIDAEIAEDAIDLFLDLDQNDMKRVLSNLIDNGVEAHLSKQGSVVVRLQQFNGIAVFEVRDTGGGIHPDKVRKIMSGAVTSGKDRGHGIGLAYVRERVEQWGATFNLESQPAGGTVARIRIRSIPAPVWFAKVISIKVGYTVVIADDDPSIHQVWRTRLAQGVEIVSVTSIDQFEMIVKAMQAAQKPFVCLVDYEFIGEVKTGIDAIKNLGVAASAILVTSRHDEEQVNERCQDLRIKMIPKGVAPVIPIRIVSSDLQFVFLDDDPFILEAWELEAREKKINLRTFSDYRQLLAAAKSMAPETNFYLDHFLGGDKSGVDVAMELHAMGFREIFLSTGYDPAHFRDIPIVKGVFGKEPPF